jgi:hypothetical protein
MAKTRLKAPLIEHCQSGDSMLKGAQSACASIRLALFVMTLAAGAPSWAQQAVGPIDASQMPNGQVAFDLQAGTGSGSLIYCGGTIAYLGIPACPPPAGTYNPIFSFSLSGGSGANYWVIQNTTNTLPPTDTSGFRNKDIVSLSLVFDPHYYGTNLGQPATPVFFSNSAPPTVVGGPQPTSFTLADSLGGGYATPPPGAGYHWYLNMTWAPGTFIPGSTVAIRAPVFMFPSTTPALSSLSPAAVTAGGSGFTLTANGAGFAPGSILQWNGFSLITSYVSATQLTASVSASLIASPGSANITVLNSGGATSNTLILAINPAVSGAPTITSLSPSSATAGGASFILTANGTGFVPGSIVQWNGLSLITNYTSANQLTASVSAGLIASPGSANIAVTNPGGTTSNTLVFAINPLVSGGPTVVSLNPSSATAGGAGFTLTANGAGFVPGSILQWNGLSLITSYVSANQLTASVSAGLIATSGSANITVLNPGGTTSNTLIFPISPAGSGGPTIVSLNPSSATAGGAAFTLTANGAGFVPGSILLWNGSSLVTNFASANQLTASVNAGLIAAPGSANISVLNPGGTFSNTLAFAINSVASGAPAITSLNPMSVAPGAPGFTLTVYGTGFMNGAIVRWNGAPLSTNPQGSPTQLTALVPAALVANPGTASITVVNPDGLTSDAFLFPITPTASQCIAQIADGGSWKTIFQVVNLDQAPVTFSFQFWDDNGNLLQLPLLNGTAGTFAGTLAVGGTAFAETPGIAGALTQGWARVTSNGRIGVLTIFRQRVSGRPDSEGTVTGMQAGSRVVLPFDNTNGYATGVAVANTNASQMLSISLTFQAESGATSTGTLLLSPLAHTAYVLTSNYPALAGVRGSITFTATTPDISVVGLRFSPTNSFTSLGVFQ